MNNYVITIGRQIGSNGKEIAERVAERLGIKVYDKTLLEAAARESGLDSSVFENADEREAQSFMGNLFSIHGSLSTLMSGDSCMGPDQLFEIQSETILGIGEEESCIIVGRCAEYVLREHPRMASIFISADHEDRIKNIMRREMVERERAEEIIEKGDKRRRSYHDYYATTKWGEARCYDLCINASRMGIERTVELIYNYIKERFPL